MLLNIENKPIFFVDAMLGNIAKKLRLMGYDSKYFSDIDDEKLIDIAKNEQRVIISKDQNLVLRSQKFGVESIFIAKEDEIEQLLEISRKIDFGNIQINGDNARCPKCNFTTKQIDKNKIQDKVPKGVLEFNEKFWKCENCQKIYWEGTHIKKLQEYVGKINERL